MHTRYNIHKHIYKVVFSVLSNNMYNLICQFGILKNAFLTGEVLSLKLKEFPKLDNPSTDTTISIIEAAKL
ncbi:20096_t:CDS:2 [Cetraspora pellucida]|uniref:20096_t:CDS:1 n=1 Tax=Cetraspora pellucida TaxID=1433469 RepID=A0A9N9N9B9_9GLOM|nr:20096_t:CDS:2 [Cetraspora pellucida]